MPDAAEALTGIVWTNDGSSTTVTESDRAGGFLPGPTVDTTDVVDAGIGPTEHSGLADFDGDGLDDLFWGGDATGTVNDSFLVQLQEPGSTFAAAVVSNIPNSGIGTSATDSTVLADVTGDGIPDVVLLKASANPDTVTVYPGTAAGTFSVATRTTATLGGNQDFGSSTTDVTGLADANGDGALDVVNARANSVAFYAGDGTGGFAATPTVSSVTGVLGATGSAATTGFGDVDGDGDADVVSQTTSSPYRIVVTLASGSGAFGPVVSTSLSAGGFGFDGNHATMVGDVTGDGLADVVVADASGARVVVHPATTGGQFATTPTTTAGGPAFDAGITTSEFTGLARIGTDTDGDGTPDVSDTDDDGDGIPTLDEDLDGDGDPRDDDSDGDGLPDYLDTVVHSADADGDGVGDTLECRADILWVADGSTSVYSGVGVASSYRSNGDGTFQQAVDDRGSALSFVDLGIGTNENTLVADVTGDGQDDVVYASNTGNLARVYPRDAVGRRFSSVVQTPGLAAPFGSGPQQATMVGDVNGDRFADLVQADEAGDRIWVYPGAASGVFSSTPVVTTVPGSDFGQDAEVQTTRLADADGDGVQDIVFVSRGTTYRYADTYLGNGDGTFAAAVRTPNPNFAVGSDTSSTRQTLVADVTGDGLADIVSVDDGWAYTVVWKALGGGRFSWNQIRGPLASAVGWGSSASESTLLRDVDGDGLADLVYANATSDTSRTHLAIGRGAFSPTGIVTSLAGSDFGASAVEMTAMATSGADTDGDGLVDCADVDDDGDGVLTRDELTALGVVHDLDGDGTPDYLDTDDDGDSLATADEDVDGRGDVRDDDTDGDGAANYLDADDDGDSLATADEDVDGSGDVRDDDTDGDGTANYLDADDDGDSLATADEDVDGSGDVRDDDTDGDGTANYLDADDDGDSLATADEDVDGSGDVRDDDTDGDGTANYLDADDDGDSLATADEDVDGSGDVRDDDTDGDGTANYLDADDDGDSLATADEDVDGSGDVRDDDTDGDGTANYLDADDDGDGMPTAWEADHGLDPLD
ncbi:VCBS repeat-containing protein, partial [Cellulomonas olei]|uniref:VCBS repeat-containing protein n=1 Tax=Cellulomonas sp. P4 TaxID=3142533 RepID=UPI0031BA2726